MTVKYTVILKGNNLTLQDGLLALSNVTLILTAKGPVLFDTGHYCQRRLLLRELAQHGVEHKDVKVVFLSHLHFDHCHNIDLFPSARVLVSAQEWEYAKRPHANDISIPWLIHEQLGNNEVEFLDGEGSISTGVRFFPAPGHTPGSYAIVLETSDKGCVVVAGDAIKYVKEIINRRNDIVYGTVEQGVATIERIVQMADRIVPGHFPELIKQEKGFTWEEVGELPLIIR